MKNRNIPLKKGKSALRRAALLCACLLPLFCCTGCMHAIRLKDRAIVQAVGIDWEDGQYRLSFQYFVPEGGGGQTAFDASKLNNSIIESTGPTLSDAISKAGREHGRQLFFGSNRILIIGREMAEHDIESPIAYFNSRQQISPDVYLMVAEGSAQKIVSAQIAQGIVPASAIEQAAERGRSGHSMHGGRLLDAVMQLQSAAHAADLPLITLSGREEEPQVKISGSALCKDGKLADILTEEEVLGILWITGGMEQNTMSVPLGEDGLCALKILGSDATLHPAPDDAGGLVMKVKISVHSAIQETLRAGFDPLKTLEIAEQEQEREIRLLTVRAIQKTVYQNGTDILGLMKAVRKYEPDYYRSHSGELEKLLQDMRFDIQIACNISRTGLEAEEDKR